MMTVADMGEGGVKNHQKSAEVLYGRSLRQLLLAFEVLVLLSVIMIVYSNFEGQPPLLISKLFDNDINPCQLHLTNSIIKNHE